jgi:cystathionine beta-lyase
MSSLEAGEDGVLFSSGMAAMSTTVLAFAGSGDHVVLMDELYGGTHAFATDLFDRLGIRYSFAATDADAVIQAVTKSTKLIIIESPTNPLLGIIDIRCVAEFARARGITTIIDNTFATPVNQRPLTLGIDVVVHSGTKYMGGHSDLCCGIAITSKEYAGRILSVARHLGGSLNAVSCYLLERSLKTLALRVERQTQNAQKVAEFLKNHSFVKKVNYPGLPDSKDHSIARSQMTGFGAMLSFELNEERISAKDFQRLLRMIHPAVSLGGVETLICSPSETSHVKMSPKERQRVGISDSLLRLSVGIEHADDIIEDISQALNER